MAKCIFQIDWQAEKCKSDFFEGGFDILRLDIFCYFNQFLYFCCAYEKWMFSEYLYL